MNAIFDGRVRFLLYQMRSIVGRVEHNTQKILKTLEEYAQSASEECLLITPELALIGYPSDDLMACQWILEAEKNALKKLASATAGKNVSLLVGHSELSESGFFYNCATLFSRGVKVGSIRKERLPSYNVFSETRHFVSYTAPQECLTLNGLKLGITICEDAWDEVDAYGSLFPRRYENLNPALKDSRKDCDVHVNISASPFDWEKTELRKHAFSELARKIGKTLLWVNRVGGQDEVLFDGMSTVYSNDGSILKQARASQEEVLSWNLSEVEVTTTPQKSHWQMLDLNLQMGLRDFVQQSGARKVVLGLSGGIDSACVAALAAKALGPENVLAVSMPSPLTSDLSKKLAKNFAHNLGIEFQEWPIDQMIAATQASLEIPKASLAYENLQSRLRAVLLMAESNKTGRLVLACGNKSEYAMGYGTLYGDIAGAMAPIGDLLKTEVYGLCHYWNSLKANTVPRELIERAPTAELAPNQKDSDSLPSYEILDAFLNELLNRQGLAFVTKDWSAFLKKYSAPELIEKFLRQEFKRYQAPPILRVNNRAFGKSWMMPIATSVPKS